MAGPQKYPGASTAYWYGTQYPGSAMDVNVVVLHTTEGRTLPSYDGGANAPNLTAVPDTAAKKLRWYQHFDIDRSSRALVNLAGGVETNTLNVCQVELVGTCDPATHKKWGTAPHIYWPQAPDWAFAELAVFLKWMHAEHGVPLSGPAKWPPYPASYGSSAGARMSFSAWNGFSGICGHMHVPENVHGDPGAIDFAQLIALAKGTTVPEEDDVALTTDDINKVAAAVYTKLLKTDDVLAAPSDASDYATNKFWTWQTHIQDVTSRLRGLEKKVDALPSVELSDTQIAGLASAVAANPALAEQIAEKVAVKLAERLAE